MDPEYLRDDMSVGKITSRSVAQFKGEPGKESYLWDTEVKGFALRVSPSGKRVYIYKFRTPDGRRRNRKIGDETALTAEAARKAVKVWVSSRAQGKPILNAKAKVQSITVRTLCDLYIEDYAKLHKKPKSVEEDTRYIERDIKPALGHKALSEVGSKDIVKLKSSFANTPVKANRVLALLSKIFNLAEQWEYREPNTNPTRHIRKFKEEPRERFLKPDELERLAEVMLDAEVNQWTSQPVIDAIRILQMTGARLREVLNMRWDYVDLQAGQIHLPDSKTGRKTIFLSNKAKRYVGNIKRKADNPYVFPGQREGSQLINIQKPWRLIRERAKLADVRIHDLRHTYASLAVAQNLSLPIVGKLLGHKSSKSTERYAHLYTDVMANAANKVGG